MRLDAATLAFATGLVAAAAGLHFLLRRAARRLPRWLAVRRGLDTGGGAAPPWEAPIALACFAVRMTIWIGVARAVTGRVRLLGYLRDRVESTVGMSVTAPLFTLGDRHYALADVGTLCALVAGVWIGVGVLARGVRGRLLRLPGADRGVQEAVAVVARYVLSILGTMVVLQVWGIDLSSLTIVASVLGVGVGFGLQNIANNVVSGLLVAFERPVKPGDFVEIGGLMGTVERIGARSTEIRTLDRVSILVPNARLLEQEVVNWSHGDPVSRIAVAVTVEYGADVRRARAALLEAARRHSDVLPDPRPTVEIRSFGESGIAVALLVWTRAPQRQNQLRSDLSFEILDAFERHGVAIPFPQQDVHLHAPALERAATAWARRTFSSDELAAATADGKERASSEALPPIVDERPPHAWTDADVDALVARMRGPDGVAIADRRHLLTTYPRTFVGSEAVHWLRRTAGLTREEALRVGNLLVERRVVHHVLDEHAFEDGPYFYRFHADEAVVAPARRAG